MGHRIGVDAVENQTPAVQSVAILTEVPGGSVRMEMIFPRSYLYENCCRATKFVTATCKQTNRSDSSTFVGVSRGRLD